MNVIEFLTATRALISEPEHWGKDHDAVTEHNKPCDPYSSRAFRFCTLGALMRIGAISKPYSGEAYFQALDTLADQARNSPGPSDPSFVLFAYNDRETTTHPDVLGLFDRAIAKLERNTS